MMVYQRLIIFDKTSTFLVIHSVSKEIVMYFPVMISLEDL